MPTPTVPPRTMPLSSIDRPAAISLSLTGARSFSDGTYRYRFKPGRSSTHWRARIDVDDGGGDAWRLAGLLVERGDFEEAAQVVRAAAEVGDWYAAGLLADLLGDLDGLRTRADAGGGDAWRLAGPLVERGDFDEAVQILRAAADAGDAYAGWRLAELLAKRGDFAGLRARADVGDEHAAHGLAELLVKQGRGEEAERLRRFGLNLDGSIAGRDGTSRNLHDGGASSTLSASALPMP